MCLCKAVLKSHSNNECLVVNIRSLESPDFTETINIKILILFVSLACVSEPRVCYYWSAEMWENISFSTERLTSVDTGERNVIPWFDQCSGYLTVLIFPITIYMNDPVNRAHRRGVLYYIMNHLIGAQIFFFTLFKTTNNYIGSYKIT